MKTLSDIQEDDGIDVDVRVSFAYGLTQPTTRDRYQVMAEVAQAQAEAYFPAGAQKSYAQLVRLSLAMIPNLWLFTVAVYQALIEAFDQKLSYTEEFFRSYSIFKQVGPYRRVYFPTAESVKLHLLAREYIGLPNDSTFLRRVRARGGNFSLLLQSQTLGVPLPYPNHQAESDSVVTQAVKKLELWYTTKPKPVSYSSSESVKRTLAYREAAGLASDRQSLRLGWDKFGDWQLYLAAIHFDVPLPQTPHKKWRVERHSELAISVATA